jgi:hypothetical protein
LVSLDIRIVASSSLLVTSTRHATKPYATMIRFSMTQLLLCWWYWTTLLLPLLLLLSAGSSSIDGTATTSSLLPYGIQSTNDVASTFASSMMYDADKDRIYITGAT